MEIKENKLEPHFYNYVKSEFNKFNKEAIKLAKFLVRLENEETEEVQAQYKRDLAHHTRCPHCHQQTSYLYDSTFLYGGLDKGPVYYCPCKPSGVYVGCHKNDPKVPLGFPADKHLRQYRQRAHEAFDPIWERYYDLLQRRDDPSEHLTLQECRRMAYRIIALHMNVTQTHYAHIGWFDVKQCRKLIKLCNDGTINATLVTYDTWEIMAKMARTYTEEHGRPINLNDLEDRFNCWTSVRMCILESTYRKPGKSKTKRKKRK